MSIFVAGRAGFDPSLVEAVIEACSAAAAAAAPLIGAGDKNGIDERAVTAMRARLSTAPFDGVVIIGEGEKDDAPMLANGERVGTGHGPAFDVAVDPLDGTRLAASGEPGAIAVIALAERGSLFDPRDAFYMNKIVAPAAGIGVLSIELSASENIRRLAEALGKPVSEVRVGVLDKPRHRALIAELRALGVALTIVGEGDVSIAFAAAAGTTLDLVLGTGGTPEGVITACAVRAAGGFMQGRLDPQSEPERLSALAAGHDLTRVLTLDDLVASERVLVVSAPVT